MEKWKCKVLKELLGKYVSVVEIQTGFWDSREPVISTNLENVGKIKVSKIDLLLLECFNF